MKKRIFYLFVFALAAVFSLQAQENAPELRVTASPGETLRAAGDAPSTYTLRGNDAKLTLTITGSNLQPYHVIKIQAPGGFTTTHTELPYNAKDVKVVIQLKATKPQSEGDVIITAGPFTTTYHVIGYASPLPQKDLSANPVYPGGDDEEFFISDGEGFNPTAKGYTVEISAKTPLSISYIQPFGITFDGASMQSTVQQDVNGHLPIRMDNGTMEWLSKSFDYYPDEEYHTYRYAVAPDQRVHIYRDGLPVGLVRGQDLGKQPDFQDGPTGEYVENLLVNGDFEGEYEAGGENILNTFEGWAIGANDLWNSRQFIEKEQPNPTFSANNHVLKIERYYWAEGWGAAEYSQIADVVPGETYTFSALAKGGYSSHVGDWQASLRIEEISGNDATNKKLIKITSDNWEEYSMDYTTTATATQVRATLYLERGDTWGNGATAYFDDVKLTGPGVAYQQKVGFKSLAADIAYFNYDATGAYAPLETGVGLSAKSVILNGTGATATLTVTPQNLVQPVKLAVSPGFTISKTEIPASAGATAVTITNISSLASKSGTITLQSGLFETSVDLTGIGTPLPQKDLSSNPIYPGGDDEEFFISDGEGFAPTDKGYTIEISAATPLQISYLKPFGITFDGLGMQSTIEQDVNGDIPVRIDNGTMAWLSRTFNYFGDEEYHTYRYAVAPDQRVHIYRDGLPVGLVRGQDLGKQPDFQDGPTGEYVENLLVNGDFEGEYEAGGENILNTFEGWAIGANDLWNSRQFIEKEQPNPTFSANNHVLKIERYYWAEGWGAAEYSQIADVVPGETYTFSALAKGGYSSHVGDWQASLRIEEISGNDATNKKLIKITSDNWEEYSMDYTTTATATQVRATLYLERGDTWGNGATAYFDNVKLTGPGVAYQQKVGFKSLAADIAYFNYDATGAYAPLGVGIIIPEPEVTGIKNVSANAAITASVRNGLLYLNNVPASSAVSLYNASGTLVKKVSDYDNKGIALPQRGFYIAVIKNGAGTKTVKAAY
ncbi:carbohydrate binding domain-containing protein [Viscerimonas tarda]